MKTVCLLVLVPVLLFASVRLRAQSASDSASQVGLTPERAASSGSAVSTGIQTEPTDTSSVVEAFALSDSLKSETPSAPSNLYTRRREPFLSGFLSYLLPGAGQLYNREPEKALAIATVMATSYSLLYRGSVVEDDALLTIGSALLVGSYVYAVVDAVETARRFNRNLELHRRLSMGKALPADLSVKPVLLWSASTCLGRQHPAMTPSAGIRLRLSL